MKTKINEKHSDVLIEIINNIFQSDVMSPVRRRENTDGRRALCNILRNEGYSYIKIGDILNKDHSTAVYYGRSIEGLLKTNPIFTAKYDKASIMFLKDIEKSANDFISKKINKLKDKVTSERSHVSTLNREIKRLEHVHLLLNKQNETINEKLRVYNEKFEKLYNIISIRTKPNTEEFIQRKLNTFYNGVYSEEIRCY
jgi:hypothetical protein